MRLLLLDDGAAGGLAALRTLGGEPAVRRSLAWSHTTEAAQVRTDLESALSDVLTAAGSVENVRLVLDVPWTWIPAILRRLSRRGELGTMSTALLRPDPEFARWQGLPSTLSALAAVAIGAEAEPVGLLKDDSGGVLLHRAQLTSWAAIGAPLWLRAYLDDQQVADGTVLGLELERLDRWRTRARVLPRPGLAGRLRPARWSEGRALQLACDEAAIVADGVPRDQPRTRRTWWAEPDLWLLAR